MHDDQYFFKHLKHSDEFLPSERFTEETRLLLMDEEEKHLKKKKFNKQAALAISILSSLAAVLWLSFGGTSFLFESVKNTGIYAGLDTVVENSKADIFIYHTHSRESFMSEIGVTNADQAHSKKVNISLVGERLAQSLENNGVSVQHDKRDYISELEKKNLDYSQSYKVSRSAVAEILNTNSRSLNMIIDIHRDSQTREATTLEYGGENFGKVAFFISSFAENEDEVLNFAELVHKEIEEKVPGLSRGVFVKNSSPVQSTYNQDLFDRTLSINIGGAGNTLEEEYRTADILAQVLTEIHQNK
ncbi:stage II sporulation protein P [Bacillus sp. AK031]